MCFRAVAGGTEDRLLFPSRSAGGYAELGVTTSRNGSDLGRCSTNPALAQDAGAPCTAFSRYSLGGYFEIQPLGRGLGPLPLDRLFLFAEPAAYFGRNLPPGQYSASMEPIMWERAIGLGVKLPKNLEFRFLGHQNHWFGRYRQHLGYADLGPNGPYGLYVALALRWSFGGWGRLDFPHRFVRGFAEFELNPSHGERDMGRCASYAGVFGGAGAPCSAFARYAASGYVELQPVGRKLGPVPFHRLFFLAEPKMFLGRNVPQALYSASAEPILLEWSAGLGVKLTESLELRFRQHHNQWLGRHRGYLGPADLGVAGPFGRYSAVSLRWYFGSWNRRP